MNQEEQARLSKHIRDIAQIIYDKELNREDSLIQQSARMQTAFSFVSAALFMVASIVISNRGGLSHKYLILVFSSITICLVTSLVLATVAQRREKRHDFLDIKSTREFIVSNYETVDTEAAKNLQYVQLLEKVQSEIARTNDNKVVLIQWSMRLFYLSLGLSMVWFVITLVKMGRM